MKVSQKIYITHTNNNSQVLHINNIKLKQNHDQILKKICN